MEGFKITFISLSNDPEKTYSINILDINDSVQYNNKNLYETISKIIKYSMVYIQLVYNNNIILYNDNNVILNNNTEDIVINYILRNDKSIFIKFKHNFNIVKNGVVIDTIYMSTDYDHEYFININTKLSNIISNYLYDVNFKFPIINRELASILYKKDLLFNIVLCDDFAIYEELTNIIYENTEYDIKKLNTLDELYNYDVNYKTTINATTTLNIIN